MLAEFPFKEESVSYNKQKIIAFLLLCQNNNYLRL